MLTSASFLEAVYPGNTPSFVRLRAQLERIAKWPGGPVPVLIEGQPGVGKTTLGRVIAVARALAVVDPGHLQMGLDRATRMVFQDAAISWYRAISLPGLPETLADSQLFGIRLRGASEVDPRIGLFEQAMTGARADAKAAHEVLI